MVEHSEVVYIVEQESCTHSYQNLCQLSVTSRGRMFWRGKRVSTYYGYCSVTALVNESDCAVSRKAYASLYEVYMIPD